MSNHAFSYRPEIDGLRTLAVIPVILFHAGFDIFSGGYIGVDVFFVISGFLITSIILREMREGRFTIAGFYERRARRILPALFFVILCCLPFAWWILTPAQLEDFAQSLAAVALFLSNILFWQETDYFAPASENKPLLHTWSLAVEEQYYVLFPLLLLLLFRGGLRRLLWATGALALLSLAFAVYASKEHPAANFYLLSSRAWELLAGALTAAAALERPLYERAGVKYSNLLAGAGLALILLAVFLFDKDTDIPGLPALLPVTGTALILGFAGCGTWTGKILSLRPVVFIGLLSYSAYLWHQPLFAFARLYSISHPAPPVFLGLSALSLILAWFSWRFVERPFREKKRFTRPQVFTLGLGFTIFFVASGLAGHVTQGARFRHDAKTLALYYDQKIKNPECARVPLAGAPSVTQCAIGAKDKAPEIVLLGDSHADAIAGTLDRWLQDRNIPGVIYKNKFCEPVAGFYRTEDRRGKNVKACDESHSKLLAALGDPAVKTIIVAMRWTSRLYPAPGRVDRFTFDNGEGGVEYDDYREYWALDRNGRFTQNADDKKRVMADFIGGLAASGKNIVLIYPVPETGWNIPDLAHKTMIRGQTPGTVTTDLAAYERRNEFAIEILDSVQAPGILRLRPADILCDEARCLAQMDGVPLYFDDDHLNEAGAAMLLENLDKMIGN